MKNVTTLGIDLAKNVFQLHGANERGKKVLTKRVRRSRLLEHIANLSPCLIGMEACGGSHYWARKFREYGHEVKMMSPQFVKPYVKSNKNDAADAEACCEAVMRPTMRFVPIKEVAQQDVQALHRVRSRLMKQRTQLTNQARGLLAEYGIVIAKGIASLRRRLPDVLEDAENELTPASRELFQDSYDELLVLTQKIEKYEKKIDIMAKTDERCKRLLSIPGIGPKTATAFTASVGSAEVFTRGRQLSAWLGLVPKQNSSGDKIRLGKISKRGDRYLRCLFVHGARAVLKTVKKKKDPYSLWIKELIARCGFNKAAVAVANKNVRIAWALLRNETVFDARYTEKKDD